MKYVSQISNKEVHIGDIWIAKYNFSANGNMGKLRPVLIVSFDDEKELIKVQMISTNGKEQWYEKRTLIPFNLIKKDKRKSYLVERYKYIPRYYLYRRIKSSDEIKKYKLNENK